MEKLVQKLTKEQYLESIVGFDEKTRTTKNSPKILKQFETDYWTFVKVVNRCTEEVSYVLHYTCDFEYKYAFNKEAFEHIKYLRRLDKNIFLGQELDMLKDQFEEMEVGEYYVL